MKFRKYNFKICVNLNGEKDVTLILFIFFYLLVTHNSFFATVPLVFVTYIRMYGRIRASLYVRRSFNLSDTRADRTAK